MDKLILCIGLFILSGCHKAIPLDTLKSKWPAQFKEMASQKSGKTHFEDLGNPKAQSVIFIHGVSGPLSSWDKNIVSVKDAGFRTVRYDLLGRGFSERVKRDYDLDLYLSQLEKLIESRKISGKILFVGSSFGCVIASDFANRHPEKVQGLVFIGPAGFPIHVPPLAKLRDAPVIGNLLFRVMGFKLLMEQNRKYFVYLKAWEEHQPYFEDQLSVEGTPEAMLSTMRHSPVQDYVAGYEALGKKQIPVRVIWGREDATFPYANHELLEKAVPQMKLTTIENSAHLPHFERAESVTPVIIDQLRSMR